jgi:proline racemase
MNAYELAEELEWLQDEYYYIKDSADMLRQQADRIAQLETVLRSIANEPIELSHDKIKWQCQDHIRWAKDILK